MLFLCLFVISCVFECLFVAVTLVQPTVLFDEVIDVQRWFKN